MDRPEVPNGVLPYLTVAGAAEAIDFYVRAFDAVELFRQPADDGRVLHAELTINGGRVMMSDDFPEMSGAARSPAAIGGSPVVLHLQVGDVDRVVAQAEAAGATVTMPPENMFWGDRYAKLRDPFGHEWSVASPAPD